MKIPADYLDKNRDAWNKRTEVHYNSEFYDMPSFLAGKSSLKPIELNLLGSVKGKSILHLQCHFGQDTLSLAREGAIVTGVDLSDRSIEKASLLSEQLGVAANFICSDVYDLPGRINEKFDIVFTSYGTIGWLPNLDRWATVIDHCLKPGGKFILVEFHPFVWMYDDDFKHIKHSYFNEQPIIDESTGTYTDKDAPISYEEVSWNHSLSEVMTALMSRDMEIKDFKEYNYSPYPCFSQVEQRNDGNYFIKPFADKAPLVYSILAIKKEKNGRDQTNL